jgi:hypothetical protein
VGVASRVQAEGGDHSACAVLPVGVECAHLLVEEDEPGHVAVPCGQCVEVGVKSAGELVAGQHVQTPPQHQDRDVGECVHE